MLDAAIEHFDNVWIGLFCKDCGRREYCSTPIKKKYHRKGVGFGDLFRCDIFEVSEVS
jgi:hypothetical protein